MAGTVARERGPRRGLATRPPDHRAVSSRAVLLLVGAITVGGLLLRLPSFDDALLGDELSTYFIATGHDLGEVLDWVRSDLELTPPLFFTLAWASDSLIDPPESLRLVSLAAGVAAIPLTYILGVRTVGRRAALLGAAFIALSPFLIFYSNHARAYALVLLLDLLSTIFLLRALDERRTRFWVAYAICSCAAVYAHYTAAFVLAGQFAWAFWASPGTRRSLLAANLAAAIALLPWLPQYFDDRNGPNLIGYLEPFGLETIGRTLTRLSITHPSIPMSSLAPGLAAAGIGVALVGVALRARGKPVRRPSARTVLVVVLALAAPLSAALYSAFGTSVFSAQNLIASLPGLALSVGALASRAGRVPGIAAAALILAALALGAVKMLDADYQRPDYEAAVRFIDRDGAPGDPVVDAPLFAHPIAPLDGALRYGRASSLDRHPVLRLGAPQREAALRSLADRGNRLVGLRILSPGTISRRAAALAPGRRLFVVAAGEPHAHLRRQNDPVHKFVRSLPAGYRLTEIKRFPGYPLNAQALGNRFAVSVYVFRVPGRGDQPARERQPID
jgi:mannosyltransferase